MRKRGMLTDRRPLIEALERETGQKAAYSGPPSFKYVVGPHVVLRDGSIESEDPSLLERLAKEGLIEGDRSAECIAFPIEGRTGKCLTNLVYMVFAREKHLNKVVENPDAFHVEEGLVKSLRDENPQTVGEFMDTYHKCGGEAVMKGLVFTGSQVAFPGFPDTTTYRTLAERMVVTAGNCGWIKPNLKETESEKYTFRVWMNLLGMKGEGYRAIRKELLDHLEGNASFSTLAARDAYYERRRPKKAEPDFIPL